MGPFWVASLIGLAAGEAQAQPRPPDSERVDEIVVTGERVPRRLLDTPSSVTVVTADQIEAQPVDRVEQLVALVPNVQLASGGEGPSIRGQDSTGVLKELFAFLGGARPRVTLQMDGRAVGFQEFVSSSAPLWDVERVEVFRSPQTTTQGRNSIAGALFVTTKAPTHEWEGSGRVLAGELHTRQASAVVSGPLIKDELAVRVAGDVGLSRMASDMADGIAGADIDRDDYGLARVKLLYEPRAIPGAQIEATYAHVQSQEPQFEAVRAPFRERRFPTPERTNGIFRTNVDSLTARIRYELSSALSATTTLSGGDSLIQRFGLPGLGRARIDADDRSIESLVNWLPDGPVMLLAGLHHLTTKQLQFIDITGLGIGAGNFRDRQSSLGLFGEATWRPAPPLAVTTGLRYQRDRQDREGQVGPAPGGILLDYDETFDALLPKVSIAYDISKAATAGLLVQRAYNPGGTTVGLATRRQDTFEAETLWNYELFLRGSFDGGRGTLAANAFYNDIRNAQRPQTVEIRLPDGSPFFATEFANAPAAETYGLEAELGWRASRRLWARAGVGLLETKVRRTLVPTDPTLGKEFQKSPNFTAAAAVDWNPTDALRLSGQLRHNGGYFSDDANSPARRVDGWTVLNVRAAYSTGPATIYGYASNAFDTFYLTYLYTPTFGTAGDPREVGVGIEARF